MKPNLQFVRDYLRYDRKTGAFSYRERRGCRPAGEPCGKLTRYGYVMVTIKRRCYLAHRLAWFYEYGEWPTVSVDHINIDKTDNRIANLRLASGTQNNANTSLTCRNSSGYKGVTWHKQCGKWQAGIKVQGKTHHLGLFSDPTKAHQAYTDAAKRLFGEFARAA